MASGTVNGLDLVLESDGLTGAGLNRAAEEFARKLVFTPARKGGKAVSSETSLTLAIALEPVGEGRFAPRLKPCPATRLH